MTQNATNKGDQPMWHTIRRPEQVLTAGSILMVTILVLWMLASVPLTYSLFTFPSLAYLLAYCVLYGDIYGHKISWRAAPQIFGAFLFIFISMTFWGLARPSLSHAVIFSVLSTSCFALLIYYQLNRARVHPVLKGILGSLCIAVAPIVLSHYFFAYGYPDRPGDTIAICLSLCVFPSLLFLAVERELYEHITGHSPRLMRYDASTGYHLDKHGVCTLLEIYAYIAIGMGFFLGCLYFFGVLSPFVSSVFSLGAILYVAIRLNYVLQPARDERTANEQRKVADEARKAYEATLQPVTPPNVAPLLALATQQLINQKYMIIGTSQDSLPIYYREEHGQEERFRNTYIIGTPGSGKSTCFVNLNAQDFYYGNGVIVLSSERRLFDRLLPLIPEKRMDDVIYLDPADLTPPIIGFNPFTRGANEDVSQHIGETITILTRAMGTEGITVKPIIENAVAAVARNPHATFADLMRLIDPANKTMRASLKTDPNVDEDTRNFWKRYDETTYYRKSYDSVYNRFDPFARHPISTVLSTSSFSFKTVMNSGSHIIFLDLSHLRGTTPITMGQLLLASIEQSLLVRDDMDEEDCIPYFLYIDEFQKYAIDSKDTLKALFNGARKYRLGITIAHQTTANIPTQLMDTIDSDTSTKIVMHVEDKDARRFAPQLRIKKAGRDSYDHEILEDLKTGQTYTRTPTHTIGIPVAIPSKPVTPFPVPIPDLKTRSKENFGTTPSVPTSEHVTTAEPDQSKPPPPQKKKSFGITFE